MGSCESARMPGVCYLIAIFMVFTGQVGAKFQQFHEKAKLSDLAEYCETEIFQPQCGHNEVVVMVSARYGRMHIGRCVKKSMGYIGCFSNVLHILDRRCSGRSSCQVRMPDPAMDETNSCVGELKTYLQAQYQCVPVLRPSFTCSSSDQWALTDPYGYISHSVAEQTNCGSITSPITITVLPGQRINITLYNFDVVEKSSGNYLTDLDSNCEDYAHIIDNAAGKTIPVCRGGSREKSAYLSSNRSVEIVLYTRTHGYDSGPFILFYQAVGCADIPPQEDKWVKRTGNEAQVGCHVTREVWTLVCVDGQWLGEINNCSKSIILRPGDQTRHHRPGLSHGVSVIIIVTIAIGIGVVVLLCGIFVIKRMRKGTSREIMTVNTHPVTDESEELEQLKVNYDNEMRKCHQNDPEILQHVIYDKSKKDATGYSPLHTCMHDAAHVQLRGPDVMWKASTFGPHNQCDYEAKSKTLNSCASQGTLKENVALVQPCTLSTFASNPNKLESTEDGPQSSNSATLQPNSGSGSASGNGGKLPPVRSFHDSVYSDRGACVHGRERQPVRNPRNIYEPKRTRVLYTLNNSF